MYVYVYLIDLHNIKRRIAVITKQTLEDFYKNKKIAVAGASRNKKKYPRMLFDELKKRGYEVIPVNPNASEIDGEKCYARLQEIPGGVDAAVSVVPAAKQADIAEDAARAGVKVLWMHEHVMKGVSDPSAIAKCSEKGVECITGFCPFMFIPETGFPHNFHKAIMKIFKALPA